MSQFEAEPFWEGIRHGRLLLQQCGQCNAYRFYPRLVCPTCGESGGTWEPVSGEGSVYSHTLVRRSPTPDFYREAPYVVALVELDEGVRLLAPLSGVQPGAVTIGMRVGFQSVRLDGGSVFFEFVPLT
jgi:uncharacterized protein